MNETTSIARVGFNDSESFALSQRVARVFSQSQLVPQQFQGDAGLANCVIALNMASRMGADPLAVMQNIYIVHGKPAWSSQFVIACVNTCGRFAPLRFAITGDGDDRTCVAWTTEKGFPERLEGPPATIGMAKAEGWYGKNGSKWKTMPELMLRYRAATFFGRMYAPEMLMGMRTQEEIIDIETVTEASTFPAVARIEALVRETAPKQTFPAALEKNIWPADPSSGVAAGATVTFAQAPADRSPQETLAALMVDEWKFTFADFIGAVTEPGIAWLTIPEQCDSFQDVPTASATKILGAKRGLKTAIEAFRAKGGAK